MCLSFNAYKALHAKRQTINSFVSCVSSLIFTFLTLLCFLISGIMFALTNNNTINKQHKVAFYIVLVILLVTLRQCQSHVIETTEVISNSSQSLPKIINTDISMMRGYGGDKNIAGKLKEIRELLRSLIFDWNLKGESGLIGGKDDNYFCKNLQFCCLFCT